MIKKQISWIVVFCFFLTSLSPYSKAHADTALGLPAPGTMVNLSPTYEPVIIKGLTVHKDNPFLFDFIVDVGQDKMSGKPLKKEGEKLIKYFLASLAIPDKDVWVNLSPYEKDRMIPEALGQTDMGRDLLEQDYILKQITASLIYPEKQLGKIFWDKVYKQAQAMYGTTQIPVNTFNKVWIMADRAEVFEHNQTAFVVDSHLKVMLEEDYLALQKHSGVNSFSSVNPESSTVIPGAPTVIPGAPTVIPGASTVIPGASTVIPAKAGIHSLGSQVVKEIILPQLEKEVNTGKNFANLRQIFNSIILSSWYKKNLKQALLNQVYADKSKVRGIDLNDPTVKQQIYEQYLKAYKKGVFNYIKEESVKRPNCFNFEKARHCEERSLEAISIPRKYFSGGMQAGMAANPAMTTDPAALANSLPDRAMVDFSAGVNINSQPKFQTAKPDAAMIGAQRIREAFDLVKGALKEEDTIYLDRLKAHGKATYQDKAIYWTVRTLLETLSEGSQQEIFSVRKINEMRTSIAKKSLLSDKNFTLEVAQRLRDDGSLGAMGLYFAFRNLKHVLENAEITNAGAQRIREALIGMEAASSKDDEAYFLSPNGRKKDFRGDNFKYQATREFLYKFSVFYQQKTFPIETINVMKAAAEGSLQKFTFEVADRLHKEGSKGAEELYKALLELKDVLENAEVTDSAMGENKIKLDRAMVIPPVNHDFSTAQWFIIRHPSRLFHNVPHSGKVAAVAYYFALSRGLSASEAEFLYYVGLLHDLDDEPGRAPDTAARVPATIKMLEDDFEWEKTGKSLDGQPRSFLRGVLGWTKLELLKAKAIIRRTEFPFVNDDTHPNKEAYSHTNPFQEYRKALIELKNYLLDQGRDPKDELTFVLREAYLLSEHADKSAALYEDSFKGSVEIVENLVEEKNNDIDFRNSKRNKDYEAKLDKDGFVGENFDSFVSKLGNDDSHKLDDLLTTDAELSFSPVEFLNSQQAVAVMPQNYARNFIRNLGGYETMQNIYRTTGNFEEAKQQAIELTPNAAMTADVKKAMDELQVGISNFLTDPKSVDIRQSIINVANILEVNIEEGVKTYKRKDLNFKVKLKVNLPIFEEQIPRYMGRLNSHVTAGQKQEYLKDLVILYALVDKFIELGGAAMQTEKKPNAAMVAEKSVSHRNVDNTMGSIKTQGFTRGGIDLNTSNGMQWKVSKDGKGVEMNIDPAVIERMKRDGINWLSPVIFKMTPVTNIWLLVGLKAPAKQESLEFN